MCFPDGPTAFEGHWKDDLLGGELLRPRHSHKQPPLQGMLKGQELSEAYASADIFVMPSETETLGDHMQLVLLLAYQHCWGCLLVLSLVLCTFCIWRPGFSRAE